MTHSSFTILTNSTKIRPLASTIGRVTGVVSQVGLGSRNRRCEFGEDCCGFAAATGCVAPTTRVNPLKTPSKTARIANTKNPSSSDAANFVERNWKMILVFLLALVLGGGGAELSDFLKVVLGSLGK